jgi:hypothetical protein
MDVVNVVNVENAGAFFHKEKYPPASAGTGI